MLGLILIILIALWFFGYIQISGINIPDFVLFNLNGHPIRLWDLLILLVVGWALSILPSPLREIASVLLVLWVLSVLGILAIAGLSQLFIIAIILGIILTIMGVL